MHRTLNIDKKVNRSLKVKDRNDILLEWNDDLGIRWLELHKSISKEVIRAILIVLGRQP